MDELPRLESLLQAFTSPVPSPTTDGDFCPNCINTGRYRPDRLYERYCECEAGRAREHEDQKQRISYDWMQAAIPLRFFNWSFETSPCSPAVIQRLRDLRADWEARIEKGETSVLLWGPSGTGKTGLAISDLRDCIVKNRNDGRFASLPALLSELRNTYSDRTRSEADVLRHYQHDGLLILDDLGAEHVKDTGWLEDRLYQIIGYRHAELQPTIFTSNLSPEELGQRIGERVMWRIVEMCGKAGIIHVDGKNLRAT